MRKPTDNDLINEPILIAIHEQCATVQHSIALNYGASDNEKLLRELLTLRELLEKFFGD